MEGESKELLIGLAIILPLAIIITIFTGRKERARKKIEWEKFTTGKTKKEVNSYIIGDILVFIGVGGMAIGAISTESGTMSAGFIALGTIFLIIGGAMIKKRIDQAKKKIEEFDRDEASKRH